MKRALILASVASMIDQFNMENINILKKMGYQVDVACNFEFGSSTSQERVNMFQQELIQNNINPYQIPIPREITKLKEMFIAYKIVNKLVNQNHYEIIHCHSPIGGVIARLASRNARNRGTRMIYTAHGFHFFKGAPKKKWIIFYPIEKICAHFTDYLITINKEDYHLAIDKNFPAKNIEYVPGIGIDTEKQKNIIIDEKKRKAEFAINDEFILISVGELNQNKNHETIIKAISKIDLPLKYIICGKGERLDHLKDLTTSLELQDKVIFAGYRSDVDELLKMSDMFCFPSYREGLSVALMEAMATGLPVVCSNIRGNKDLINDGKGGYLVSSGDSNAFRIAILNLMKNRKLSLAMGQYNTEKIKAFDRNVVDKKMLKIYSSIAKP